MHCFCIVLYPKYHTSLNDITITCCHKNNSYRFISSASHPLTNEQSLAIRRDPNFCEAVHNRCRRTVLIPYSLTLTGSPSRDSHNSAPAADLC